MTLQSLARLEQNKQEQRHGGDLASRGKSAGASARREINCRLQTRSFDRK